MAKSHNHMQVSVICMIIRMINKSLSELFLLKTLLLGRQLDVPAFSSTDCPEVPVL
jgi:hypothetical protein